MLKNQDKVLRWHQNHHNKAKLKTVLLAVLSLNLVDVTRNTKEFLFRLEGKHFKWSSNLLS